MADSEVIATGAMSGVGLNGTGTLVITDGGRRRGRKHGIELMEAIKDTHAGLEKSVGDCATSVICAVKDAEAAVQTAAGDHYAGTLGTVKDAESRLSDRLCRGFDVAGRDACDIRREVAGVREQLSETVRDRASTLAREMHVLGDRIDRDVLINREKNAEWFGRTFEKLCEGREQTLLGFKNMQAVSFRLAAEAEKTACNNQMQVLLQFKDQAHQADKLAVAQALLSEKLACQASKELAAGVCELKERIAAEGAATRALMGSQEIDRLRDRALKAESTLNAYFSAKVAPVTPM